MPASFSILVTGSPTTSQAHISALRFIAALVKSGHQVANVFFYQDAVHVANKFSAKPSDELQLTTKWVELSKQHNFELQVCVAASNRRAIISAEEAENNGFEFVTLNNGFTSLGLGQLAVAFSKVSSLSNKSDRDEISARFIHFK